MKHKNLMKIREIYNKYNLMPNLQVHQLRVGGVASAISKSLVDIQLDITSIVAACLLHDMGNILKFKLDLFPEFLKPKGLDYWQEVKEDFRRRYGSDEHVATLQIIRELESEGCVLEVWKGKAADWKKVIDVISRIGFSQAKENFESENYEGKIAAYSDMRVEPHAVTSLQNRLKEGNKRFLINKPGKRREKFVEEMSDYLLGIENQIFEKSKITPKDINYAKVMEEIRYFS